MGQRGSKSKSKHLSTPASGTPTEGRWRNKKVGKSTKSKTPDGLPVESQTETSCIGGNGGKGDIGNGSSDIKYMPVHPENWAHPYPANKQDENMRYVHNYKQRSLENGRPEGNSELANNLCNLSLEVQIEGNPSTEYLSDVDDVVDEGNEDCKRYKKSSCLTRHVSESRLKTESTTLTGGSEDTTVRSKSSLSPSTEDSSPAHRGVEKQDNRLTFKDGRVVKVNTNKLEVKYNSAVAANNTISNKCREVKAENTSPTLPAAEKTEVAFPSDDTDDDEQAPGEVTPKKAAKCQVVTGEAKEDRPNKRGRKAKAAKSFKNPKDIIITKYNNTTNYATFTNIGMHYPIVHDYIDKGEKGKRGNFHKPKSNKKKRAVNMKHIIQQENTKRTNEIKKKQVVGGGDVGIDYDQNDAIITDNYDIDEPISGFIKDHFRGHPPLLIPTRAKR